MVPFRYSQPQVYATNERALSIPLITVSTQTLSSQKQLKEENSIIVEHLHRTFYYTCLQWLKIHISHFVIIEEKF